MNPPDAIEVQRAFGYAGAGALALKALDLIVKWRSGQRVDTLAEFEAARKIGADIREDLRRELEATRIDLAAVEARAEKAESELRTERAATYRLGEANEDLKAKLRIAEMAAEGRR
ncbi:MAG: hypothetical protein PHS14_19985 [Elusimicrobia bacterium]|nr:hypothetical protein [Elusimicrobiota bacterium]